MAKKLTRLYSEFFFNHLVSLKVKGKETSYEYKEARIECLPDNTMEVGKREITITCPICHEEHTSLVDQATVIYASSEVMNDLIAKGTFKKWPNFIKESQVDTRYVVKKSGYVALSIAFFCMIYFLFEDTNINQGIVSFIFLLPVWITLAIILTTVFIYLIIREEKAEIHKFKEYYTFRKPVDKPYLFVLPHRDTNIDEILPEVVEVMKHGDSYAFHKSLPRGLSIDSKNPFEGHNGIMVATARKGGVDHYEPLLTASMQVYFPEEFRDCELFSVDAYKYKPHLSFIEDRIQWMIRDYFSWIDSQE